MSLPKQLAFVYVGVAYGESADGMLCFNLILSEINVYHAAGNESTTSRAISISVLVVTGIFSYFAILYILREMRKIKGHVVDERRKARCVFLFLAD